MPDISILNAGGTAYTIKDAVARTQAASAVTTANDANTAAQGAVAVAASAQTDATQAITDAATAQSTANKAQTDAAQAITDAATAQSTADEAKTNAATAQSTADSKLTAPAAAGTAGQVLTLDSDAATPVWADPSGGGGGGLTKWGAWQNISGDTQYTAETNGWIFVNGILSGGRHTFVELKIDGEIVFTNIQDHGDLDDMLEQYDGIYMGFKTSMIVPVFAGQTYIITGDAISCRFAPCV